MQKSDQNYIVLCLLHLAIALAVFVLPFLSKIYSLCIVIFGFYYVIKSQNKNNEVLYVAAYLIGVEIFLRMTGGNFNNEYVKTLIVAFLFVGMLQSGFSKKALVYLFYFILLLPGVILTMLYTNPSLEVKKAIVFNISGPVCLGVCALYCYQRRLTYPQLQNILVIMGLPIITTLAYLVLYTPSVKDVVTGTQSNFATSGGFGPNQVATILGLGMFVFFCQSILMSKSKRMIAFNAALFVVCSYRALVTFSRGGVITAFAMIIMVLLAAYWFSNHSGKSKLRWIILGSGFLLMGIWSYSAIQTSGLINKRYANQDATGREKKDRLGGREQILNTELELFKENPVLGVGTGMGKSFRGEMLGQEVASHNEITRLLAEHGMFGVIVLLLLLLTPLMLYLNNYQNIYFFSFYLFWLLTINHAAMRTAAPAFIYALSLLTVQFREPQKKL